MPGMGANVTDSMSLNAKVTMVTGAGSGMGAAHAEILAEQGAHVIVQDLGGDDRCDRCA